MDFRFSRFEIVTGTGALFVCLVFVCVFVEASAIENHVAAAALEAAQGDDLYWVAVEARGRHLVLSGASPDENARRRAVAAAAAVSGVSGVDDRITVIGDAGQCQRQVDDYLRERAVRFKAGRAELSRGSYPVLARVARIARECGAAFEVASHTDSRGDAALNLKLTQRRAETAARLLVQNGVPPQRLRAVGYGESQPVADNASHAGRAANRRLELRVIGMDT